ncbi:MAG: DNA polymerase III subunit beta [Gammaproteobacteria bacterium]
MKFTVQREAFLRTLQIVCGVVERRQTLPILSHLLFAVDQGRLTMTATDLEVEIIAPFALADKVEDGKITVPARKLLDICRTLPDDAKIEISLQKERLHVRSGKSRFTLATLPATDFPNVDVISGANSFTIAQSELKRIIDATQFAMAQQDVRYYLNGLMLELGDGKITAVATDGHRLALCEANAQLDFNETRQAIVPRKAVTEMSRLLTDTDESMEVQLGTNHIQFTTSEMSFTSKLIDGRFPDYQSVLPKGGDKHVSAERIALRQALTRASVLSNEKYRSIRFHLTEGTLRLHAHNPDQEEAEEELAVDYHGSELEIGFNAGYLLDTLSAISEERVTITLSDGNSSCLIQGRDNCKYVVMPMRL